MRPWHGVDATVSRTPGILVLSHKAFVRGIPCSPDECRRYRGVFASIDFVQTWTPFEAAANSGRDEALALLDRMIDTQPHPRQVPLAELSVADVSTP